MSAVKKRKHVIESDDDEVVVPKRSSNNSRAKLIESDEEMETNGSSKSKSKNKESKTGKRRIVLLDSDDEPEMESKKNEDEQSISEIKKNAKARAKKLISNEKSESPTTTKTPPEKPKNSLFNYFKPRTESKPTASKPASEPISKEKIVDKDGFEYTYVKGKGIESPKDSKISDNSNQIKKEAEVPISRIKSSDVQRSTPKDSEKLTSKCETVSPKKIEKKQINAEKVSKTSPKKESRTSPKKESLLKENESKHVLSEKKIEAEVLKKEPKLKFYKTESASKVTEKEPIVEALPKIVEPKRISDLLVDKYKPTSLKQIIGQQTDKSSMNKLYNWLRNWNDNFDKKPAFSKWGSDDGAGYKAAILSGPPGIGKTTTATLVCKQLGYDVCELNASDVRSKKSLSEDVRELLRNTKLTNFFKPKSDRDSTVGKLTTKHCLVMDEVDGMAGNEDRGGIAELILLIKTTKVPVICICNDRSSPKIRSLVNYCFDLRFPKPKAEQIKASLMSIAFKEKISIPPNVLNDLIVSSNYDIRQCIGNLGLLGIGHTKVSSMINSGQTKAIKDVKLVSRQNV